MVGFFHHHGVDCSRFGVGKYRKKILQRHWECYASHNIEFEMFWMQTYSSKTTAPIETVCLKRHNRFLFFYKQLANILRSAIKICLTDGSSFWRQEQHKKKQKKNEKHSKNIGKSVYKLLFTPNISHFNHLWIVLNGYEFCIMSKPIFIAHEQQTCMHWLCDLN